jgi:MIF4G like
LYHPHLSTPACRAFGGCIKTLFEAAARLDALLLHRAASLLAYFVSNNDYKWPWVRWERVLEVREPLHRRVQRCRMVCSRLLYSLPPIQVTS